MVEVDARYLVPRREAAVAPRGGGGGFGLGRAQRLGIGGDQGRPSRFRAIGTAKRGELEQIAVLRPAGGGGGDRRRIGGGDLERHRAGGHRQKRCARIAVGVDALRRPVVDVVDQLLRHRLERGALVGGGGGNVDQAGQPAAGRGQRRGGAVGEHAQLDAAVGGGRGRDH